MEVEDAGGFKKLEQVGFDENAEGGEDAEGGGVLAFEVGNGGEVGGGAGVKKQLELGASRKSLEGVVGEGAVAEEDDFGRCERGRISRHRGRGWD